MEEEKKLYPLTFTTLEDVYNWGKEEFKIADLGYRDSYVREGWLAGNMLSEVMDMYMDSVVGDNVFEYYGRQFPFQIKEITVSGKMPLRVHPDDKTAAERYDALGKEKLWIVLKAEKDARLVLGFKNTSSAEEFYNGCLSGDIERMMNVRSVREGEYFIIPSGTPHAAFGHLTILEVSESSALDFCLSGWGEAVSEEEFDQALTIDDALDFINFQAWKEPDYQEEKADGQNKVLSTIPQFTVNSIGLKDPIHIQHEQSESCTAYYCVSGKASFQTTDPDMGSALSFNVDEGKTILIPADVSDFIIAPIAPGTELIEVFVEKREESDPYINTNIPIQENQHYS